MTGIVFPSAGDASTYGWRTLLDVNLKTLTAADWSGESSVTLGGYDCPILITTSSSWTDLGPDGSTGVVVDPAGSGTDTFEFAPTFSSLASHFSLTTNAADLWAIVLSWSSLTQSQNNSYLRTNADTTTGNWLNAAWGNLGGASTFRVDDNVNVASASLANVSSLGCLASPNGLFASFGYSTSETRDYADLTVQGSTVAAGMTLRDAAVSGDALSLNRLRAGAVFVGGEPDAATLTGLSVAWCPRLGA